MVNVLGFLARHLVLVIMCVGPVALRAQSPAPQHLSTRFVELPYEFNYAANISGVVELRDGRTIIVNRGNAEEIILADWVRLRTSMIGGHGRGPGEYLTVGRVFPFGGDSALVQSQGFRVVSASRVGEPLAGSIWQSTSMLAGIDLRGRKLELHAFAFRVTVPGRPPIRTLFAAESLYVVLLTPGRARLDTLARVRGPHRQYIDRPMEIVPGRFVHSEIGTRLVSQEQATIYPDGWIAIAFRDPYRVDWYDPAGAVVRGPPLPLDTVVVDTKQKRADLAGWLPNVPSLREDDVPGWPKILPAYIADALRQMPDGQLLIERTPDANATELRYDIVDRRSRLTGVLMVPKNVAIRGVGAKHWYAVFTDADDVPHLRRYER